MLAVVRNYWESSYWDIRYVCIQSSLFSASCVCVRKSSNDVAVMIHDAFQPISYWSGFMQPSDGYEGVLLDTHIYQVFSDDVS